MPRYPVAVLTPATALVLALAVAGCASSGSASAVRHTVAAAAVSPSPIPADTSAPVPAPPPQPQAEANWETNSPGYQSWLDVGADVNKLGSVLDAGNYVAAGRVGLKMAEAAAAALRAHSPVDRHEFKQAMGNLGLMGAALTSGNMTAGDHEAHKALRALRIWATAAQPGAAGADGCGDWTLPQSSNC
jgi:hypothetical protein